MSSDFRFLQRQKQKWLQFRSFSTSHSSHSQLVQSENIEVESG